jgi:molybdate transport system permease protein
MTTMETGGVIGFTLWVCALSTLSILPAGIALGWLLARREFAGKSIVETFLALPLVMPPVATGLILLRLLGRHGWIGGLFERVFDEPIVFTWRAVVVAAGVMSFPLLLRSARVAFQEVEPRYEQVARTLGAGELRVFGRVTLPLARRGILSGIVLAYARALGEFGATILVAGNIPGKTSTLSLSIYQAVQLGDDEVAYRLLAISAAIAFIAIWSSEHLSRKRPV